MNPEDLPATPPEWRDGPPVVNPEELFSRLSIFSMIGGLPDEIDVSNDPEWIFWIVKRHRYLRGGFREPDEELEAHLIRVLRCLY